MMNEKCSPTSSSAGCSCQEGKREKGKKKLNGKQKGEFYFYWTANNKGEKEESKCYSLPCPQQGK